MEEEENEEQEISDTTEEGVTPPTAFQKDCIKAMVDYSAR